MALDKDRLIEAILDRMVEELDAVRESARPFVTIIAEEVVKEIEENYQAPE